MGPQFSSPSVSNLACRGAHPRGDLAPFSPTRGQAARRRASSLREVAPPISPPARGVSPLCPCPPRCFLGAASSPFARQPLPQRRVCLLLFSPGFCHHLQRCSGSILPCRWLPLSSAWLGPSQRVPTPSRLKHSRGGSRRHPWCGGPGLERCAGHPPCARAAPLRFPQVQWCQRWIRSRRDRDSTWLASGPGHRRAPGCGNDSTQ